MNKKTLGILAVILIVIGVAGLVLSSGYSGLTYGGYPVGYSPQWGSFGEMGPGGMMGGGMMGGNMLVSGGFPYNPNGSLGPQKWVQI